MIFLDIHLTLFIFLVPVYKSGCKDSMDNYHLISLLGCFSKVLEKIVCTRLSDFLEVNNLLSGQQFGFCSNHFTSLPMVKFMNYENTAVYNKEHAIATFCDFRKAFNTVNHKILLSKMAKVGINGTELQWFQSY